MKKLLVISILLFTNIIQAQEISRICFGSCAHQSKPIPILNTVVAKDPNLFVFLGDNIYGDTDNMFVLKAKYRKLGKKAEFKALRDSCRVLATWDDHDYGRNDAGREYRKKERSKKIFLDFWDEPDTSSRYKHKGIYTSYLFGDTTHRVQVIVLDERTFRSPLIRTQSMVPQNMGPYLPNHDSSATMLGDEQWKWLEEQLKQPAKLRIICSATQFAGEFNGHEAWANFPYEKMRMMTLIRETKANGVIFISGDPHYGEISEYQTRSSYPIYDITSSGLTETWYNVGPNAFRKGDAVRQNNFGMLSIDWNTGTVKAELYDISGNAVEGREIKLSQLK